jgi:hypothetical protein
MPGPKFTAKQIQEASKRRYQKWLARHKAEVAEREALRIAVLNAIPPIDLAYAAGIIDGEGCISICQRANRLTYRATVVVQMCDPQAIEFLHKTFGGSLNFQRVQRQPNHRPCHAWGVAAKEASYVCRLLLPFLRVKRQQALNVIELQQIHAKITRNTNLQRASRHGEYGPARKGKFQIDPELLRQCEALNNLQHELNHRGCKVHEVAAQIPNAARAAMPIKAAVLKPAAAAA